MKHHRLGVVLLVVMVMVLLLAACSSEPVQGSLTRQVFGTASNDVATDVAAPKGGVGAVVVGITNGSLDGVNKGDADAFIRKYNSGGVVWARQFGTSALDYATIVAVTPTGISYVVGSTNGALGVKVGLRDVFLRKYDANGVGQWTKQFGTTGNDYPLDVTLDSSGNVYVLSLLYYNNPFRSFEIRKFSPNGNLLLTITNPDFHDLPKLAVDSTGNIFVLSNHVGANHIARLYKYNSSGILVASPSVFVSIGHIYHIYTEDLIVDSSNNLYFSVYGNQGGYVRKVNNAGATLWTQRIDPAETGAYSAPGNLDIGPKGSVFVTGHTLGAFPGFTNAGKFDIFVLQLNGTTGARLWTQQFGGNDFDFGYGLAVSDRVYVAGGSFSNPNLLGLPGHGLNDAYLAQLDRVTGAILSIDQ